MPQEFSTFVAATAFADVETWKAATQSDLAHGEELKS